MDPKFRNYDPVYGHSSIYLRYQDGVVMWWINAHQSAATRRKKYAHVKKCGFPAVLAYVWRDVSWSQLKRFIKSNFKRYCY